MLWGWIKRKKEVKPECVHYWHKVGEEVRQWDIFDETFYYKQHVYCPKCDSLQNVRKEKAEILRQVSEIKHKYLNEPVPELVGFDELYSSVMEKGAGHSG